ncbi:MAG: 23S rRNA pseudouridine synthase [Chloroflexi bacterium]|nr:MAG: 23S rRNA pseudouridine synthase [Chloroflexota bacterium]
MTEKIDNLSRTKVVKLIQDSLVLINNKKVNPSHKVNLGESIEIELPDDVPSNLTPWQLELDIIYEDNCILVIDKPAGIAVHPAPGHQNQTIANALINHNPGVSNIGANSRPGIIHRLDMDTSGLLITAKNELAHRKISEQFADRTIQKSYYALVNGIPENSQAIIDAPIGRSPFNRQQMDIVSTGKSALTQYEIVDTYKSHSLLKVSPRTGRTHQIRVHLKSIGHPVVGDSMYGKVDPELNRHFLHASSISFTHPESGEPLSLKSDLPIQLSQYIVDRLKSSHDMEDTKYL